LSQGGLQTSKATDPLAINCDLRHLAGFWVHPLECSHQRWLVQVVFLKRQASSLQ